MKKLSLLLLLFLFVSCTKASLTDTVTAALAAEETLPAGSLLFYGKHIENSMSRETLSDYLGLENYPDFAEQIEEMALYASLVGDYAELCVLRVYDRASLPDAVLFLERRIAETKRALSTMQKSGYADTAFVYTKGNTAVLFMLPDNEKVKENLFS